jgi:hypothetical protein
MAFPVSHKGQTSISHVNLKVDELIGNICFGLKKNNSSNVNVSGTTITFDGNLFNSLSNWNVLSMVNDGEIVVNKNDGKVDIKYRVNFVYSFVLSIVIVAIVAVLIFLSSVISRDDNILQNIYYIPAVWLIIFGINYMLTIVRLPSFIQRMAKSSVKQK